MGLVIVAEAQKINHLIRLEHVMSDALNDLTVASYLLKGDEITVSPCGPFDPAGIC